MHGLTTNSLLRPGVDAGIAKPSVTHVRRNQKRRATHDVYRDTMPLKLKNSNQRWRVEVPTTCDEGHYAQDRMNRRKFADAPAAAQMRHVEQRLGMCGGRRPRMRGTATHGYAAAAKFPAAADLDVRGDTRS